MSKEIENSMTPEYIANLVMKMDDPEDGIYIALRNPNNCKILASAFLTIKKENEDAPVVYGRRFKTDDQELIWSWDQELAPRDTHKARLVRIEEIKK